jgi:F-type H+-transporting ATPase subunit epsilon
MFNLVILTPEEPFFKGKVTALVAPGSLGYLEILSNHAPIITILKQGDVIVRDSENKEHSFVITSGLLEVHRNEAILLADGIQLANKPHIILSGLA